MSASLHTLVQGLGRPTLLVVGDLMLDRYVWGDVSRISPEAPVPVLRVERVEERLGGAASVAGLLAALGVEVRLAGDLGRLLGRGTTESGGTSSALGERLGEPVRCLLFEPLLENPDKV